MRVKPTALGDFYVTPTVGPRLLYSPISYWTMSHEHTRNREFMRGIRKYAPGKVVLDIGTGEDAIWAISAAVAGAKKVYAIEALRLSYERSLATIRARGF